MLIAYNLTCSGQVSFYVSIVVVKVDDLEADPWDDSCEDSQLVIVVASELAEFTNWIRVDSHPPKGPTLPNN